MFFKGMYMSGGLWYTYIMTMKVQLSSQDIAVLGDHPVLLVGKGQESRPCETRSDILMTHHDCDYLLSQS